MAAVATALIVALLLFRTTLAARVIAHTLASAGFPGARFDVEEFSTESLRIGHLEAGPGLRIDRVEAFFDLSLLPGIPIGRLRVSGARVEVAGSSSPTSAPDVADVSANAGDLPLALLPALELEDVRVTIATTSGPVQVKLDSHVSREDGALRMRLDGAAEGGGTEAVLHVDARLDPGGAVSLIVEAPSIRARGRTIQIGSGSARGSFELDTAGLALRSGRGRMTVALGSVTSGQSPIGEIAAEIPLEFEHGAGWLAKITAGDLRLPGRSLHLAGIRASGSRDSAEIHVDSIESSARERPFEPLALDGRVAAEGSSLRFGGELSAARGRVRFRAEGTYATESGIASATLTMPRIELARDRLRPTEVSAALAALGPLEGALEGAAIVRRKGNGEVKVETTVTLDELSTVAQGMAIDGLSGRIVAGGFEPPRTKGLQTVRIRRLHPGVEFRDLELGWALDPVPSGAGSLLRIDNLTASFAGGRMLVADAVLDPHQAANRMEFRFEDVDVAQLFAIAGVEGVTGSGRLGGKVPVSVRDGAVSIDDGTLEANSGVLQFRSEQAAQMLAGGGQSVDLLLSVLRDFHYERLVVKIHKALAGEASVTIRLEGKNPEVLEGYPFRINLNVSGNLDRLVGSLLEVARLSDRAVRATVSALH